MDDKTPSERILNIDLENPLAKNQALKLLKEILNTDPNLISFTSHCGRELKNDNLTTVDAINTLRAGRILVEAEAVRGTWRYRVETTKIMVVISFQNPHHIRCVTAWRK